MPRSSPDSTCSPVSEGIVKTYKRRPRKPISCEPCRRSKLRCDRKTPCVSCTRRKCVDSCVYERPSGAGAARLYSESRSQPTPTPTPCPPSTGQSAAEDAQAAPMPQDRTDGAATSGEPGDAASTGIWERHALTHERWEEVLQRPMNPNEPSVFAPDDAVSRAAGVCFPFPSEPTLSTSDLLAMLPPAPSCDYLIAQFFTYMAQFFPILHGPTFQKEYAAFVADPSAVDFSWLALLFMLLSVGLHTLDYEDTLRIEIGSYGSLLQGTAMATRRYREAAMICLSKDQFLTRYRLTTLQALLLIVYEICHEEGVERGWTLLGIALNISIALQCNSESPPPGLSLIEIQRRRRCWAGLLSLYAYQIVSYPGVDMLFLTNVTAAMPADVNDVDIREDSILPPSRRPTQMSVMIFKIRLFKLSTRICRHLKGPDKFDEKTRDLFDAEIAEEQRQWNATFPIGDDDVPSLLDFSSFAHWSLQFHGHHLYLLIHQPFCRPRSNSTCFRQQSRAKCITSGAALLELHRRFSEVPRLRPCRWTLHGLHGFYAIHGAIALASCLLEEESQISDALQYRDAFIAAVNRVEKLQHRSPICVKAYPILSQLQTLLFPEPYKWTNPANSTFLETFDTWVDNLQWLNPDTVDWNVLDGILGDNG
ncbi:putative Zn -C6 fungal-type DNA-binding domain [Rosellinia necatrix]|uniref:Putative Zn-C6 fungal-type DNA-binding domain n=1 Tax=Rosellinia necatrix TaxID=77044 RepID=A0A1W2TV46_ROSNE|nr:putative Zn -C6 fungal-type DNA-binding domain [Rosellinia necatrix]